MASNVTCYSSAGVASRLSRTGFTHLGAFEGWVRVMRWKRVWTCGGCWGGMHIELGREARQAVLEPVARNDPWAPPGRHKFSAAFNGGYVMGTAIRL